ncbi:MAG: undecaprenyl-phosphate glucose phosphotransferase [Oceanospirillaceae bacterium]|nr:undecaprenyl-phosphate glucose phosphotransferase [Thalassolituus sp.]MBS51912.1 undecaprenyl-phosphate glucose phosphotransferase [Oceanospirillaceae bacterium]|tara:strand:- start:500 stop:1903 length:1404 start_codon:yes stop_codon:yes gene_type:complete
MNDQGLIRSNQNSFSAAYRMADVLIILLVLLAAVRLNGLELSPSYMVAGLIAVCVFLLVSESLELYRSWRSASVTNMLSMMTLAWLTACAGVLLAAFSLKVSESFSRIAIGAWMLSTLLALFAWRLFVRNVLSTLRRRGLNSRRVVIVGVNASGWRMRQQIKDMPQLGYRFMGFFDDRSPERVKTEFPEAVLQGSIEELIQRAKDDEFDVIYIALPLKAQKRIAEILERCGDTTASVHLIPDFFVYNLLHARLCQVGSMQTLSVYETPVSGVNDVLKRMFDIVFSLCVLSVIAIPMLVIAAIVKITSPGPAIFKQLRYGLDGRSIEVWKFRSMSTMDNGSEVKQATKGDARITPVGAFIRKTSLDELPQFINVLQGSMSVVGPRPHAVAHNEQYRKLIPYYMLRHKVKPGITGWAQINGYRGETDTLDKMSGRVDYDLDYIRHWSLWMDIKIILLTLFKGFTGKNVH